MSRNPHCSWRTKPLWSSLSVQSVQQIDNIGDACSPRSSSEVGMQTCPGVSSQETERHDTSRRRQDTTHVVKLLWKRNDTDTTVDVQLRRVHSTKPNKNCGSTYLMERPLHETNLVLKFISINLFLTNVWPILIDLWQKNIFWEQNSFHAL